MTDNIKIILASASPRRHELLLSAGLPHCVLVTDADETPTGDVPDGTPYAEWFALTASRLKGEAAMAEVCAADGVRTFVVSADTVVSPDMERVFGKPKSRSDAVDMMRTLSGGVHYVVGGLTVAEAGTEKRVSRSVITEVRFKKLTEGEIDAYTATSEPYDKAGSYGIQGIASLFVESVVGDYANVVGISVAETARILTEDFGVPPEALLSCDSPNQ